MLRHHSRLLPAAGSRSLRLTCAVTAACFAAASCVVHHWQPIPLTEVSVQKERLPDRRVRVLTRSGWVDLRVTGVAYPFVEGHARQGLGEVLLGLANVSKIQESDGAGRLTTISGDALVGKLVRFETGQGAVTLLVTAQDPSFVRGNPRGCQLSGTKETPCTGVVRADFREVSRAEIHRVAAGKSIAFTVLGIAGTLALLALIVALTKESCPFVYVEGDDGLDLVGEAYAGAAFRSLQRDDLLPLPAPTREGRYRVLLRNEARETQYTDRAELVVVDHPGTLRVLSTFDGRLVGVGPSRPPTAAVDTGGRDRRAELARRDDVLWSGDLERAVVRKEPPLREGLTVRFDRVADERAVLELVAGNTYWLDLVFGRFFAAMGTRLAAYQDRWNAPEAGPRLLAWKDREGVDLRVEARSGADWTPVAVVPTVGPMALREVAVPLPATLASHGPLEVRLSGGTGFWRVDSVRMSTAVDRPLDVHRLAPVAARSADGTDARARLLAADGAYHALAEMDEELDLAFELPPSPPGRGRSLFLSSNGYYNVHPPIQGRHSPETVRLILQDPGGLGRFGLALAAEYAAELERAPRAAGAPR